MANIAHLFRLVVVESPALRKKVGYRATWAFESRVGLHTLSHKGPVLAKEGEYRLLLL